MFYCQFYTDLLLKSVGERVLHISQHLAKLEADI